MKNLLSVTSLSGGKTSSFMALKYPTDRYVFALVKTNNKEATPADKGLLREINSRVPDFVATTELDQTLINLLKLEQEIGKKIDWVSAPFTFEDLIEKTKRLPNRRSRLCTQYLKIDPIFEYCYHLDSLMNMVIMHIGFRYDEKRRKKKMLKNCKKAYLKHFPFLCDLFSHRQKFKTVEWRIPYFPLIEDGIKRLDILKFWHKKGWKFPEVSNCDFCFFHSIEEQREQLKLFPDRFNWWVEQEEKIGHTWDEKFNYVDIFDPSLAITKTPFFFCSCTD